MTTPRVLDKTEREAMREKHLLLAVEYTRGGPSAPARRTPMPDTTALLAELERLTRVVDAYDKPTLRRLLAWARAGVELRDTIDEHRHAQAHNLAPHNRYVREAIAAFDRAVESTP